MKQRFNTLKNVIMMMLSISAITFMVSCEEAFEFDLPEAGSIPDEVLPQANFSTTPDPENFRTIKFTNTSSEATNYIWDFGGGDTSTEKDPIYTFEAGEGDYEVTLTALDANEASGTSTQIVEVRDVFVPIDPIVGNGDFENKTFATHWQIAAFTGGTTTTVNTSSDGAPFFYDGTDAPGKTGGMKFASGTSNPANPGSRRYAYQPLTVSPTTPDRTVKYVIEYQYAIKVAATPGSNITVQILDGHFDDGADALASTPLTESVASELNGKGNFETVKKEFTSNESGQIAIWIFADTDQDAYIDNVKVYPKP